MNWDVFFLFFNAVITTVLSAVIVIWILRTQYLPVIRRLENKTSEEGAEESGQYGTERGESK